MLDKPPVIRLSLPAELRYRDVAVRTVAAACKLVGPEADRTTWPVAPPPEGGYRLDLGSEFEVHVVSAFSEAFNNIAIHAYQRHGGGHVDIEIDPGIDRLVIEMRDSGISFDPARVAAPELDKLPESGMGLFIIHSFVDEFTYTAGPPNVWRLTKIVQGDVRQVGAIEDEQRLDG